MKTKTVIHIIGNKRIEMHGDSEFVKKVSSKIDDGETSRSFNYGILKLDEFQKIVSRKWYSGIIWEMIDTRGRQAVLEELKKV